MFREGKNEALREDGLSDRTLAILVLALITSTPTQAAGRPS